MCIRAGHQVPLVVLGLYEQYDMVWAAWRMFFVDRYE